jgi:hypothetical protein
MPIDTSIYQQPPSQGFNTPFQTLAQIGAIQQQRQNIASNAALEQERQAKLKEDQKKQADADQFNTILTNVGLFNRDAMRTQVQQHAPDKLQSLEKWYADFDKTTEEYQKAKNESEAAAALAEQRKTQVVGTVANGIAAHGYTPTAFAAGLNELGQKFPKSQATWDNYAQLALQNGPGWIKEHVDGLRTMADRSAAAELPEKAAKAEEAQKVNAGTSPTGMTANQQAEDAARQVAAKQGAQRIGLEAQRVALEQKNRADAEAAKVEKAAKGRPMQAADVNKISDLDKSISELKDLGERLKTGSGMGTRARLEAAFVPGGLAPYIPGAEEAKATAADIKLAQQVAGRAVHGGVLRKNDQEQAEQYLPKQDDPPQVVQAKLANILKLANDSKIGHIENLKRGGFDVSGFQSAIGASAPLRKEIPGHPGSFAVSKDDGKTWQAE